MLTAARARGVIGCREIDAQHPEDRGHEALGLTQRSVEDETERQGGFDGEIGILELPAPPADASRCPRGDRVRREPEGDVASPHEGSVVLGPVPDAIRCLVLRMHSRLHIEIMTRRRSRWSTCRPLLAHRAESAHQRPDPPAPFDSDDAIVPPSLEHLTIDARRPKEALNHPNVVLEPIGRDQRESHHASAEDDVVEDGRGVSRGAAAEHAPGPQSGTHLDGRTQPCGSALVADERAELISLQVLPPSTVATPPLSRSNQTA